MDGKYVTLKLLMDTLAANNGLLDWNCFTQKNGKIVMKVQFKDGGLNINNSDFVDLNVEKDTSLPPDMSNKDKHNYLRARSFRQIRASERPRSSSYSDTPEIIRNSENCDDPCILDSHICISSESLTHGDINNTLQPVLPESALNRNHSVMDPAGDLNKIRADSNSDDHDSVSSIDYNNLPPPFDVENFPTPFDEEESLYDPDENPYHPHNENNEKDRTPCRDADCHYAEEPFAKWRHDIFKRKTNIFTCKLCGRKICNWCTWAKRRHLIHLKHFRNYSYELPEGRRVDIKQLMEGRY